ncbi:hypothetical protein L198_07737 [Cryptococcus wingfieldii CBS 7118]|uniref:Uncharacterized protein n=1 Tax=Cryptococcus wingfieldii CBS 7118 TaxID=1295528 RepID=A0A1E3I170_9TREE|nr:hypothetical protein L198_07737 [Cryptococcus wingfieldii CBS 7118]ODN82317.1 hypothetical protein L198_07737 [Cryptococcus wingfieldii CBS 7118]
MSTITAGRPVSKSEWGHFHRLEGVKTSIVIEPATDRTGEVSLFVMKNKSHHNAFCKACVKAKKEILEDTIEVVEVSEDEDEDGSETGEKDKSDEEQDEEMNLDGAFLA